MRPALASQVVELEPAVEEGAFAGRELAARAVAGGRRAVELGDDGAEGVDLRLGLAEALGGIEKRGGGEVCGHGPMTTRQG